MMAIQVLDIEGIRSCHPARVTAERLGLIIRRSGQQWSILCPFHDDRNPSAVLYPGDTGYCFTCQKPFDSIDLVRQVAGLGFREACAWLEGTDGHTSASLRLPVAPGSLDSFRGASRGEVMELWMGSRRASEDDELAAWLESFRLCPSLVGDLDLTRLCHGRPAVRPGQGEEDPGPGPSGEPCSRCTRHREK